MQPNSDYRADDPVAVARALVEQVGWASLVSHPAGRGLIASHYPIILAGAAAGSGDAAGTAAGAGAGAGAGAAAGSGVGGGAGADGIVLIGHMCRPDALDHQLGRGELLVIVTGPEGYISPSWYPPGRPAVPTWNYVTAHLTGVPELLADQANWQALEDLVAHFERPLARPRLMRAAPDDARYASRVASATVGFRLAVTGLDVRVKLSQDKPPEVRRRIIEQLEAGGPYANPALAAAMRRINQEET
ncbi:MAG: FMN-binding negative transcriptional regulator [Bifidobacteriaceae bacterium]|jgi:transcriptional regulator|nr:FMN-binding negative transcriptional regulator [Bifidobacteriaceae bacterium]